MKNTDQLAECQEALAQPHELPFSFELPWFDLTLMLSILTHFIAQKCEEYTIHFFGGRSWRARKNAGYKLLIFLSTFFLPQFYEYCYLLLKVLNRILQSLKGMFIYMRTCYI